MTRRSKKGPEPGPLPPKPLIPEPTEDEKEPGGPYYHGPFGNGGRRGNPNLKPGPGVPKNVPQNYRDLREALTLSLANMGGVEYLDFLARYHPKSYVMLLGKLMPQEIKAELRMVNDELIGIMQQRREQLAKAKADLIEDAEVVDVDDER